MKHIKLFLIVLGIFMLVLVGCTDNNTITGPERSAASALTRDETVANIRLIDAPKAAAFPIMTDKATQVGTVSIQNDRNYIYITYMLDKDWTFREENIHVAANINGIPRSREGYPSPHQYAHQSSYSSGVRAHSTLIELSDYDFRIGQDVIIAANFVLENSENSVSRDSAVIAWGGNKTGPGPEWWNVITYTLAEERNPGSSDRRENVIVLDNNDVVIMQ